MLRVAAFDRVAQFLIGFKANELGDPFLVFGLQRLGRFEVPLNGQYPRLVLTSGC